jgi:heat-inducible transcriptional repressor
MFRIVNLESSHSTMNSTAPHIEPERPTPTLHELNEREQQVLLYIIRQHVLTAQPIGSRTLSKITDLKLSSASIRNVMADLEERGLIGHPHTSAGRVPTDMGYRYYVDSMMQGTALSQDERSAIDAQFQDAMPAGLTELLRSSSHLLSRITQQLAVVAAPSLSSAILERVELVSVTSDKLMVIISVRSGIIKTIILNVRSEVKREQLDSIASLLNERLAGLTFQQIRESFADRLRDSEERDRDIIRLFIDSSDRMFAETMDAESVCIEGMKGITRQPEFEDADRLRNIIELVENQDIIVHVLHAVNRERALTIRIGQELQDSKLADYSIIAAPWRVGQLNGTVSIVGPKRMDYPRMAAIVQYLARMIST